MSCRILGALVAVATLSVYAEAPQYFRSNGGVAKDAPAALLTNFAAPGALVWKKEVAHGHSTPVIAGGKVILTAYDAGTKRLLVQALEEKTGRTLWEQPVAGSRIEPVHRSGSPAAATPAWDGERIYVFFGSFGLLCYDSGGKKVWEHPLGPFQDEFGRASSPVFVDGKVILAQDHDVDSFVMAIDGRSGKQIWKTPRPNAVRSYSTPAIWSRKGSKEILVAGALALTSYDPASGKELWSKDGLARIVIPIPVPVGETIYMASWAPGADGAQRINLENWNSALGKWDGNGDGRLTKAEISDREVLDRFFRMDLDQSGTLDNREWDRHAEVFRKAQNSIMALKPSEKGDVSEGDVLWKHGRGIPYVATPVVHNGKVWMVKDGGIVTVLKADTGKLLHEERLPALGNYYASPLYAGGKIYFASEAGVVSVLADADDWKVLSSHAFEEKIYATPVVSGDRLFIRTEKALYCFRNPES